MKDHGGVLRVAGWIFGVAVFSLFACGTEQVPVTPPAITVQPQDRTIEECGGTTFEVQASGTPPLRYQWFRDGTPIPGATEATYHIARAGTPSNGRRYSASVENSAGSVASDSATLSVIDAPGPVVIAAGKPFGLATDGTDVFWTDGLGVYAGAVDCEGPIRTLYSRIFGVETTYALVLAIDRVVWTDLAGAIRSASTDGAWWMTLASALGSGAIWALAAAGEQLYWPNYYRGIQTVGTDGGAVTTFAVGELPLDSFSIAADDRYVYWADSRDQTIKRMDRSGGQVTVLAEGQGYLSQIVTDGMFVYWATSVGWETDSPTGYIRKVSREGGAPSDVARQPSLALGLAVHGSFVYWTSGPLLAEPTGSVSRAPLDGGEPAVVLASGLELPFDIQVDDRYVYWVDQRGVVRLSK